ncbi:MAG: Uma2 family endonuclease [Chloroflexia bacterium]|nr:Uma2 family endonuclease [Chloroflexia bacterium]
MEADPAEEQSYGDSVSVRHPSRLLPVTGVEIVSPSTKTHDRVRKHDLYARHGVSEYWLVDPDAQTITVLSDPRNGRYETQTVASDRVVSVTIPGLRADLAAIFTSILSD